MRERMILGGLTLLLSMPLAGCIFAAGAAAGSGVYFTSRGAEAIVQGSTDQVADATRQAFETLGIQWQGEREKKGGEVQEIWGLSGEDDVTVEVHRKTDSASRLEIRVRQGAVTWDKDMAKRIVDEVRTIREG